MSPIVQLKLKEARRRLRWGRFGGQMAWALAAGLTLLLLIQILALAIPPLRISTLPWPLLAGIVTCPLLGTAVGAWAYWSSNLRVAREIDARAGTRDRFVTSLTLEEAGDDDSGFASAIDKEVAAYAAGLSLHRPLPIKFPGYRFLWILLPLLLLIGLEGFLHWRHNQVAPEREEAQAILAEVRKVAAELPEDELVQEAAQELEAAQQALQYSPEPLRDALRTLADLENTLASQASLTAAERAALAEALAPGQPQLASALRANQREAAAKSLSELDPEALAQALEEAARHLKNSRLRELARQPATLSRRTLTEIVRGSGEGNSEREKLLTRIEDLKSGQSRPGEKPDSQEGDLAGNAPPGEEESTGGDGENLPPGGGAGSELDKGHGEEIAREGERDPARSETDDFIPGLQGDGASMVELLRSAGSDDPELRQAYRSAFETAQPAALDAVDREEIPPGSRLLVRRYFEAIRPKE